MNALCQVDNGYCTQCKLIISPGERRTCKEWIKLNVKQDGTTRIRVRGKLGLGSIIGKTLEFFHIYKKPGCGCGRRENSLDNLTLVIYYTYIRLWNDNSLLMKAANMVCKDCFGKARRRKALREERNKPLSLQEKDRQEAKDARRESPRKRIEVKNPMNTPPL